LKKTFTQPFTFFLILLFSFNSTYSFAKNDGNFTKKTDNAIPILVYHLVSDNIFSKNTNLFVKPKKFEEQIQWIDKNGYTTIFADELAEGKNYEKPLVITFDDGYIDNYEVVFQLIKKYKLKITIFVITDMINKKNHLTSDQILEMSDSGLVSIQSHTKSHSNLQNLNEKQLTNEFKESKEVLFKLLGKQPTIIAYPYGRINPKGIKLAKEYYTLGYSTSNGNLSNSDNKFAIKRYGVGRGTTISDIKKYIDEIDKNNESQTDKNK